MKKTLFLLGLMLFVGIGTTMAQRGNGRAQAPVIVNQIPQRPSTITPPVPRTPEPIQRNPEVREVRQVETNPNGNLRKIKFPKDFGLTDLQKRQINHIFKNARETGATKREVYHQVLRVLTPQQEEKLKERLEHLFGIGGNN